MNLPNASAFAFTVALSSLVGCVYEDHSPRHWHDDSVREDSSGTSSGSAAPSGSTTTTTVSPMLVEVDTDQTMNADGGEGVGVFVEYFKGGHWHIWLSCDTTVSSKSCAFDVTASVTKGSIANEDFSETRIESRGEVTGPGIVGLSTTTTTELSGFRFDTDPGAIVTVQASLGGLQDGSFLFFVQDGKVNGGYTGQLTNPLQFRGTSP